MLPVSVLSSLTTLEPKIVVVLVINNTAFCRQKHDDKMSSHEQNCVRKNDLRKGRDILIPEAKKFKI